MSDSGVEKRNFYDPKMFSVVEEASLWEVLWDWDKLNFLLVELSCFYPHLLCGAFLIFAFVFCAFVLHCQLPFCLSLSCLVLSLSEVTEACMTVLTCMSLSGIVGEKCCWCWWFHVNGPNGHQRPKSCKAAWWLQLSQVRGMAKSGDYFLVTYWAMLGKSGQIVLR